KGGITSWLADRMKATKDHHNGMPQIFDYLNETVEILKRLQVVKPFQDEIGTLDFSIVVKLCC
ncbi:hypothetical protein ACQP3J_30910, partial [Escherichia coli]